MIRCKVQDIVTKEIPKKTNAILLASEIHTARVLIDGEEISRTMHWGWITFDNNQRHIKDKEYFNFRDEA